MTLLMCALTVACLAADSAPGVDVFGWVTKDGRNEFYLNGKAVGAGDVSLRECLAYLKRSQNPYVLLSYPNADASADSELNEELGRVLAGKKPASGIEFNLTRYRVLLARFIDGKPELLLDGRMVEIGMLPDELKRGAPKGILLYLPDRSILRREAMEFEAAVDRTVRNVKDRANLFVKPVGSGPPDRD
jgi:hypothetical protein